MNAIGYMAVDQYGQTYHIKNSHPRKYLLDYLGGKKADKMYVDTTNGTAKHIGYIIKGLWLRIYKVCDWKNN